MDLSMYPASFRQGIIVASKHTAVGARATTAIDHSEQDDVTEEPSEISPPCEKSKLLLYSEVPPFAHTNSRHRRSWTGAVAQRA